jgi:hypothetical protein
LCPTTLTTASIQITLKSSDQKLDSSHYFKQKIQMGKKLAEIFCEGHNFKREPPKQHPSQIWFNLVQWYQ